MSRSDPHDYERLASELLRALRGTRSQVAFSRRLGSRSNVAYTWEAGRRFPTGAKTLWAASRVGIDVADAVRRFYRADPAWLQSTDPTTPEGVAALLTDLKGRTSIRELAARTGRSRFAVSRWLDGETEPRLPDLLRIIEAASLRVLDFIGAFVDPLQLPTAAPRWVQLQAARRAVYELPWSHIVLRLMETRAYAEQACPSPEWIAEQLGIDTDTVTHCLKVLHDAGQVHTHEGRAVVAQMLTVDTNLDPDAGPHLKRWAAQLALERMQRGAPALCSYNLFTVSQADYEALRELQLAYFRQLRSVVGASEPAERVILANLQLIELDRPLRA